MDSETRRRLDDAARRDRSDLVAVSIRELLGWWGHKRRGFWVISRIEEDLDEIGLITDPPFTQGWIDTKIRLVPKRLWDLPPDEDDGHAVPEPRQEGEAEPGEVTLLVGSLRSAGQGVSSVAMDASLLEAQTLMMRNDFSQLAVMSDARTLRGAITWESIAQASMRRGDPQVRDCIVPAELVRFDDDLIHHIPRIIQAGYVFVQSHDRTISGIVTTADLSDEFARLATPFFLIGEVERRLRRAVNRLFTPEDLRQVRNPQDDSRDVASAEDLTMGEYVRLLEHPDQWAKTGWKAERKIFIDALNGLRELRNEVMHFSPDPLDAAQVDEVRHFIRWLKILDP